MPHPWENVPLSDYEAHMSRSDVGQLQALSAVMQKQMARYPAETLAILGVAGGNGLEHINTSRVRRVFAIDINGQYLNACRHRFSNLGNCLSIIRLDFCDESCALPDAELYIANLFIEYIGVNTFAGRIALAKPRYASCVIQKNGEAPFVSNSPYRQSLQEISSIHADIDPAALTDALKTAGYALILTEEYPLPGTKSLIRLDYSR